MESFREIDMRAEQVLAMFMDEYFYSRLESVDGGELTFSRIRDRDSQIKGVDVCIRIGERELLIDEKASVYYSNAMIPTFAFELDSIQNGKTKPVEGWFINDSLRTEYYMLIWPNVKCEKKNGKWIRKDLATIKRDDFTIVEAMLIEKKDIRLSLEQRGYDKYHLAEYARKLRLMYSEEKKMIEQKLNSEVKLTFSGQLAEAPINLVIKKEMLRRIAKSIYLISCDGYATIKGAQ